MKHFSSEFIRVFIIFFLIYAIKALIDFNPNLDSYTEYHCFVSWDAKKNCLLANTINETKYKINEKEKSILISDTTYYIQDNKFYSRETKNQIWSNCTIVDTLNFECLKADTFTVNTVSHKKFEFEIFRLINGQVTDCSYCYRVKPSNYLFHHVKLFIVQLFYEHCTWEYDSKLAKCPKT